MDFEKLIEDSKEEDLTTLKEEINQIMLDKRYMTDAFTTYTFNGFYRARKHNNIKGNFKEGKLTEFINEKEFWNPPTENAKIGRCNDDGESMFYCANDIVTAILEVKPEVGDFITVSNFDNLFKDKFFKIQPLGKKSLSTIPELKSKLFKDYKFDERQNEIEEFLDKLFHQNVEDNEAYKYKLSIAIAHLFLTETINYKKEVFETHGLLYPSVIRNQKSYCFVLRPWLVHSFFQIKTIQTLEFIEKGSNYIKIKLLRNGYLIGEKLYPNNLDWLNAPNETPEFEMLYYDEN